MSTKKQSKAVVSEAAAPLRLDIGCGKNKKEGFIGVDQYAMEGVDIVFNVAQRHPGIVALIHPVTGKDCKGTEMGFVEWPWADNSVDEAHCSHFIEHLTNFNDRWERVNFFNELYRVLKPGAQCTLVFPHWCSARYYGDPTHKEPMSEWWSYYLDKNWRKSQAPHTDQDWNPNGYRSDLDFLVGAGYNTHPDLSVRSQGFGQFAIQYYKEAAQDIVATLTKR